ncbi:MAG TPA: hypothetical protein DEB24_03410 [Coriobacteriia bacterium]|nr:hypothetical protein [Coriobacteriia bacterium]
MPGTSEATVGFPQPDRRTELSDYPLIKPAWADLSWLTAFTVQARRGQAGGLSAGMHDVQRAEATADEVFDFTACVCEGSRRDLEHALAPLEVTWLSLEHEDNIIDLGHGNTDDITAPEHGLRADAAIISQPGTAVAFTTADCLPILLVSENSRVAAGIHAGWKSLAAGIVEGVVQRLERDYDVSAADLRAWIGPAVAREDYEISTEVRDALLVRPAVTSECFTDTKPGHFLADLPMAATQILTALGVPSDKITHHPGSTRHDVRLHSARRDSGRAGRMATVVGVTM